MDSPQENRPQRRFLWVEAKDEEGCYRLVQKFSELTGGRYELEPIRGRQKKHLLGKWRLIEQICSKSPEPKAFLVNCHNKIQLRSNMSPSNDTDDLSKTEKLRFQVKPVKNKVSKVTLVLLPWLKNWKLYKTPKISLFAPYFYHRLGLDCNSTCAPCKIRNIIEVPNSTKQTSLYNSC